MTRKPPWAKHVIITPEQRALFAYQEKTMQLLETHLSGGRLGKKMSPAVANTLSRLTAWIAQEQTKAFEHGASADECARWMANEIRLYADRLKPN